jgi:glutamate racemase
VRAHFPVSVVGVIEPGAKAAAAATRNKKVGVIGTEATVNSNSYTRAIEAIDRSISVFSIPCPLFVPIVEEGWTDDRITEMVAERYLSAIREKGIDTLVLGCTHYPLLKPVFTKVMGSSVRLIDSAIETAREIHDTLAALSLLNNSSGKATHEFYVTDSPEKFLSVGERFLGRKIEHIEKTKLEMEV